VCDAEQTAGEFWAILFLVRWRIAWCAGNARQNRLAVEVGSARDDVRIDERQGLQEPGTGKPASEEVNQMLYTIAVVLLVLWALGLVSSYTLGGFIHVLLVVALVMILVNVISGRRAL
jgi:hypothetical protein